MAELTPEQLAAWKAGEFDADRQNRRNEPPDWGVKPKKADEIRTGPRGGKYRINSNGRKSYDVP